MIRQETTIFNSLILTKKYIPIQQMLEGTFVQQYLHQFFLIAYSNQLKLCFRSKGKTLVAQLVLKQSCFQKIEYDQSKTNYKNGQQASYICQVRLKDFNILTSLFREGGIHLSIKESMLINSVQSEIFSSVCTAKLIYLDQSIESEQFIQGLELPSPIFEVTIQHLQMFQMVDKYMKRVVKFSQCSVIFTFDSKSQNLQITLVTTPNAPAKNMKPSTKIPAITFSFRVVSHKNLMQDRQIYSGAEWRYVFLSIWAMRSNRKVGKKVNLRFFKDFCLVGLQNDDIKVDLQVSKKSYEQ